MTYSYIQEKYTDKYVKLGVVFRVYFHALYVYQDGHKEWHYFGSKVNDYPPTTQDTVFEHTYVQFPDDMLYATGNELLDLLYGVGGMLGEFREGLR